SDRVGREVIGNAAEPLLRNYNGESSLGDVITSAMLWKSGAEIAFENAGGIRGDLASGPITRYDTISALPFMNTRMEMNLTGKDIRSILEQSLTLKVGMLQIAGMTITYDLTHPEYHRLISAQVGEEPLNDARSYKIVASSFIGQGGDHYSAFLNGKNVHDTGELLSEVLTEYVRHVHALSKPDVPRMTPVDHATR
ncbi:MAG: 5'-nucleotidase C-terminal domain-containing protein, partial [Candidatus Acidiferrales bacterium]